MGFRDTQYIKRSKQGVINNISGSLFLMLTVEDETDDEYHLLNRTLNMSITQAATGGGGIIEIRDSNGIFIKDWDADTIKNISWDSGELGEHLTTATGLEIIVYGAAIENAYLSINWRGFISNGKRKDL